MKIITKDRVLNTSIFFVIMCFTFIATLGISYFLHREEICSPCMILTMVWYYDTYILVTAWTAIIGIVLMLINTIAWVYMDDNEIRFCVQCEKTVKILYGRPKGTKGLCEKCLDEMFKEENKNE